MHVFHFAILKLHVQSLLFSHTKSATVLNMFIWNFYFIIQLFESWVHI